MRAGGGRRRRAGDDRGTAPGRAGTRETGHGQGRRVDASCEHCRLVTAGRALHRFDAGLELGRLRDGDTRAARSSVDDIRDSAAPVAVYSSIAARADEGGTDRTAEDTAAPFLPLQGPPSIECLRPQLKSSRSRSNGLRDALDELIGMAYSTAVASPERARRELSTFDNVRRRARSELPPTRITVDAAIGRFRRAAIRTRWRQATGSRRPRTESTRRRKVVMAPARRSRTFRREMPKVGIEPTLPEGNRILSPARLPVPPLRRRTTIGRIRGATLQSPPRPPILAPSRTRGCGASPRVP